jgi:tripartite-type tricarboxylate transporter receptor subunit TctC
MMMKLPRRKFLHLAGAAAALPALPRLASALDYPARPVHLLVGYAPGGGNDIAARLIGQWLSERTGQSFIIENRPGAATNVATEAVAKATPDGYTLLLAGLPNTINATLYDHLNFNFIRDIAPVAGIARTALVMVVNPSVPAKTLPEFVAYAKANPGKLNIATNGDGSPPHLAGELFRLTGGVDLVNVPYHGTAPSLAALLGGQVQVFFASVPGAIGFIRSGKLRALAVTTEARSDALPDVPTVGEFIHGYEASIWYGIGAPGKTPAEVIDRLNREINGGLADPKMRSRLADLGAAAIPASPADFGKLVADETEKWAKVIQVAKIKPDQ